jgi:putative ATPase
MSECAVYLAASPKSNSTYVAIDKALSKVRELPNLPVPLHLRNAPTKLMKELNYGKNYKYSHDYQDSFEDQEYLPDEIKGTAFYEPGTAFEKRYKDFLSQKWQGKYGY